MHTQWYVWTVCIAMAAWVLGTSVTAAADVAEAPAAVGGKTVLTGAFYGGSAKGATIQQVAERISWMAGAANQQRDDMLALRRYQPAGKPVIYLLYVIANEVQAPVDRSGKPIDWFPWRNQWASQPGDWAYIDKQESWFLHDANGKRIQSAEGWHYMNPASPGWRQWVYARAQSLKRGGWSGYDGLFLDNLELTWRKQLKESGTNSIAEFADVESYAAAVVEWLAGLRQAVGDDTPIWANLIEGRYTANEFQAFRQAGLSGAFVEAFATGYTKYTLSPAQWLAELSSVEAFLASGGRVMLVSQGNKTDLQRMRFGLGSYLLVVPAGNSEQNPLAMFRYTQADANYSQWWYYPEFDVQLGQPVGERKQAQVWTGNMGWRRDFAGGYVEVDPVKRDAQIVTY